LEEMLDIFKLDEFITEDGTKALDVINTEGRKVANAKMEEGYQTENVVLIFEAMIEHPKKKDINETALTRLWDLTRKKGKSHETIFPTAVRMNSLEHLRGQNKPPHRLLSTMDKRPSL
jgi:hypothetical protein